MLGKARDKLLRPLPDPIPAEVRVDDNRVLILPRAVRLWQLSRWLGWGSTLRFGIHILRVNRRAYGDCVCCLLRAGK